jgi:hypothetical protein
MHGCLYCVRLFWVCVVLCVGRGLATGWSSVQGVLKTVYRIKKLKKRPRPNKGLQGHNNTHTLHLSDQFQYYSPIYDQGFKTGLFPSSLLIKTLHTFPTFYMLHPPPLPYWITLIIFCNEYKGRAIAEAVSRWLPTAAARVLSRVWSSGICGGQWRWGRFSPSTSVSPANFHSTKFSIFTITRGRYNRPVSGRRAEWPSLDSTPHYAN